MRSVILIGGSNRGLGNNHWNVSQFLESMGTNFGGENVVSKLLKGEQIRKTFGSTGQLWKGRKVPPLGDPHVVNNTLARGKRNFSLSVQLNISPKSAANE